MSSTLFVLLAALGFLSTAFALGRRRRRKHRAVTPLRIRTRKPTPEDPRHRAPDEPGVLHQAVALTPAVGIALTIGASTATAATPVSHPPATTSVVSVSAIPATATSAAERPSPTIASLMAMRRQRLKEISRSARRPKPALKEKKPLKKKPTYAPAPKPAVTVKRLVVRKPPPPAPRPIAPKTAGIRDRIISIAKAQLGLPYVYGAEKPGVAFDCSGLTEWVFARVGVNLPRTADAQYHAVRRISAPRAGDLVFYLSGGYAYHVGIFLATGRMIVAPHTGDVVKVESIYGSPVYGSVL